MASVQRFSAKVIAVRQLTHDVRQIDFRLMEPREIRFKAGQDPEHRLRPGLSVVPKVWIN